MDSQSRQQALDNISAEDLAKIQAHQAKTHSAFPVDDYWLIAAEFAQAFGWQAYLDYKNNKIELSEMMTLIEATRKLKAQDVFYQAQSAFIGSGSSQSEFPGRTFEKLTRGLLNNAKADE